MASVRDLIKLFNSGIANDKDAFQRQENIENIAHKVEISKSSIIGDADSDDDKPRENPFVNKPQTVFASKIVAKAPTVTTIFSKKLMKERRNIQNLNQLIRVELYETKAVVTTKNKSLSLFQRSFQRLQRLLVIIQIPNQRINRKLLLKLKQRRL